MEFIFGLIGWLFALVMLVLWFMAGDARKVATAKFKGARLLQVFDLDARRVRFEPVPVKDLVESKGGEPYLLGNWPSYTIAGVRIFPVVKNVVTDFDPSVMLEVNKARLAGAPTFRDMLDMMIQEKEVEQETPDGQKVKRKVKVFTPLAVRTHRIVKVVVKNNKRGPAYLHIEEYAPIDIVRLDEFYNRKFSGDTIKKIIKEMETICQERIQRAVAETARKFMPIKLKSKAAGGMSWVYWIYGAIAIFIILLGLKFFLGR